jgi:hypothetical protein
MQQNPFLKSLLFLWATLFSLFATGPAARAADLVCDGQTAIGTNCRCDLRSLRPLQGGIGMAEVRDKADKIVNKPDKELKDLRADPIKVVRGPAGALFVTDHHHGARAWLLAGYSTAVCSIQSGPLPDNTAQFWEKLQASHKVQLTDANGRPVSPERLPTTLEQLPDDPYRSLAWMVRKQDGFCRALMPQKEFAEFQWADWLRQRSELSASEVAASPETQLPTALKLVKSPAAKAQPGYRGDRPDSFVCPKDN